MRSQSTAIQGPHARLSILKVQQYWIVLILLTALVGPTLSWPRESFGAA